MVESVGGSVAFVLVAAIAAIAIVDGQSCYIVCSPTKINTMEYQRIISGELYI